jgi:putative ABC transport system permease protein
MFRNYIATAWRSASRDRLYAILNLFGLGIGFAAAIMVGLYLRDEFSYDHLVPGYQDVYRVQLTVAPPGRSAQTLPAVPSALTAEIQIEFPEMVAATRVADQAPILRHGEIRATEPLDVVDPSFFTVLAYPMLRGDAATALAQPDAIVLSRRLAEKYFGTIDCLGQTLDVVGGIAPLRVTGVFENLPSNLDHRFNALLSGLTAGSTLAELDQAPPPARGSLEVTVLGYVRMKSGVSPATMAERFADFVRRHYPRQSSDQPMFTMHLMALTDLHLHHANPDTVDPENPQPTLLAIAVTGIMILTLAGINFVNLVTARASRRSVEVGVRKALGATYSQLVIQFMGESVAYSLAGLLLGVSITELCLPTINAFLDRTIELYVPSQPEVVLVLVGLALLLGLTAGIYPALVLSGFRPAAVLKARATGGGSARLRFALVVLQFTAVIALLIATSVIYRQNAFATSEALHFDKSLVLTIDLEGMPTHRDGNGAVMRDSDPVETLKTQLAAIPGVSSVAASWAVPNTQKLAAERASLLTAADQPPATLNHVMVDIGFFSVYGIRPIAGRDFAREHADDIGSESSPGRETSIILNETAVRKFGFPSPDKAIGQEIAFGDSNTRRIVGVVPDFSLNSIHESVPATAFTVESSAFDALSLKLVGTDLPRTLDAIDAVWHEFVPQRPIDRSFVDDRVALLYVDTIHQGQLFATFAAIAILIGCLGLLGLSAFTAERRTKEIGVRKALGASTFDIVCLLVWQFSRPVLFANFLAWPLAWWSMRNWLDGFAYRIDLAPQFFLFAGLGAITLAVATTAFHTIQVARARPALALRYE